MKRWHIVLIIAIVAAAVALAVWIAIASSGDAKPSPPSRKGSISGSGIIEAGPDESHIGSNLSGVVTDVYVKVGDKVEVGAPLFKLDDRDAKAQVQLARTDLEVAKKRVNEAKQELADRRDQYERVEKIVDKRAVSIDEVNKRRFAKQLAEAKLDTAMAEEMRARARLKVAETNLDLLTTRSPLDGQILQVTVDVGEYASAGDNGEPLIIAGGEDYEVKVDVHEDDAWRFNPKGKATATLKGNSSIRFPLEFVYVEPFVVPKQAIRVLQVQYRFEPGDLPVYIGQQVDVIIEVPEDDGS